MTDTPLLEGLQETAERYNRNSSGENLARLRFRYRQLRKAGLSGREASIASHWTDEKIETLIKELNS